MNRIASLSLDLDNKWSYLKTHGDAGWEDFPSYLDTAVPRFLELLSARDLRISVFVVGQDAALEKNREAITKIHLSGHEIENHSFSHEPWLHLYSRAELAAEIERAENAIEEITGRRPLGFRGPGFSASPTMVDVLVERGYDYDCSTLPTYIGPVARFYHFLTAGEMPPDEKEKRKKLFGKFSDGVQTLKPFVWQTDKGSLIEIPVTTLPVFKIPIHTTYVLYLSSFSRLAGRLYWRNAIRFCRFMGIEPSLLLHPLDFLGGEDVPELKFFPGMSLSSAQKAEIVNEMLDSFQKDFTVVSTGEHAKHISGRRSELRQVVPC